MTLDDAGARLVDGAPIRLDVKMPDFPAELRLDYLNSKGRISHIAPGGGPPVLRAPGAAVKPGENGLVGNVGWPFGTDLIIGVASSAPLFAKARAHDEEAAMAYLKDLQSAIDDAKRRGAQVTGAAAVVDTAAR